MNKTDSTAYKSMVNNLNSLRAFLPKGYIKIIAEQTGHSEATISNALQGKTRRYDIIDKAIDMALENKRIAERLNEVVNK